MREFDFHQPTSIADASQLLGQHGDAARAMAGGTALLLAMRQRLLSPPHVISLDAIQPLRGITFDAAQGLRIGAFVRHAEIGQSEIVKAHYPMLAQMAGELANPQVRNQGTLGGNLCYADPATDPPSCLLALAAQVRLASARGERVLAMHEFLVDYYTTALAQDEVLVEILIPPPPRNFIGLYARHLRTAAEHRPLVIVAITALRDHNALSHVRLVVGASVPFAQRCPRAEAILQNAPISVATAQAAAQAAADEIEPLSDARGSADYRREIVRVVVRRGLETLLQAST
jgi:aerobic carbon-monoxide dehydrogenase medium subunit